MLIFRHCTFQVRAMRSQCTNSEHGMFLFERDGDQSSPFPSLCIQNRGHCSTPSHPCPPPTIEPSPALSCAISLPVKARIDPTFVYASELSLLLPPYYYVNGVSKVTRLLPTPKKLCTNVAVKTNHSTSTLDPGRHGYHSSHPVRLWCGVCDTTSPYPSYRPRYGFLAGCTTDSKQQSSSSPPTTNGTAVVSAA
jgi:hypothetical protein